jgi:hypothetical protein
MESRVAARPEVRSTASAPRVTPVEPRTKFTEVFANTAVQAAERTALSLPGAPLMALAMRGAPSIPLSPRGNGLPTGRALASPTIGGGNAPEGPGAAATPAGVGETSGVDATLAQSQEMNLYYLRIQEEVNAQNRQFTTISNCLKAEHETVKTAIGNIR